MLINITVSVMELIDSNGEYNYTVVNRVKEIVDKRYSEKLTVNDISREMNFSRQHIYRIFSRITGMKILEYITEYRIERAKELLKSSTMSVGDIARSVGYHDCDYFTKIFKERTGTTPDEYKK